MEEGLICFANNCNLTKYDIIIYFFILFFIYYFFII